MMSFRKHSLLATCLAGVLTATIARGEDWPTCRHDNRRTALTSERLAPPLSLDWIYRSPSAPAKGWARPVNGYGATKNASNVSFDDAYQVTSVGEMVYFSSSAENCVYAVDGSQGVVRWMFHADGPVRLAPTVSDGKVYFGADDGTAYCLDADEGTVVWKVRAAPTDERMLGSGRLISLWPIRTDVMVERGRAYFTAGLFPSEGIYFYAVDAETGRIFWRRQLDRGGLAAPSPQGYLLACSDSIYMTSRTAPTRWSMADGSPIPFATPIPHHEYRFHNGGSYAQLWGEKIVYGQAAILAYGPNRVLIDKYNRPRKGELVFHWFNARRVLFKDELAYLATDYHLLAVRQELLPAMAEDQCKEFEQAYKRHRVASYLTALETLAEVGEESPLGRQLKATSLKWGEESFQQWPAVAEKLFDKFAQRCEWMTPIKANEALIMAGDILYAGGENGVTAIDAATGRLLWSDETGSRVRGLAVANGRLLVSTTDGNVRCYTPGAEETTTVATLAPSVADDDNHGLATVATIAKEALEDSGVDKGYCLILAGGDGRLAMEIARRSKLNIYVLESDADQVALARRTLTEAGLYGNRITIEQSSLESLPFPPYVFNLIIDQGSFDGHGRSTPADEVFRVTKPCGGVAYSGRPPGHGPKSDETWTKTVRGRVEGSADWTHNYATAANTYCNEDPLVKGPFGILWYGEPGPRKRIERHATPPVPLVVGATMFLTGYDRVMAYDIYNGIALWDRTLLGATRGGLPMGTSNLVADEKSLFVVVDDRECLRLDAATGETLATYPAPPKPDADANYWGWIAKSDTLLYGSRPEVDTRRRRANPKTSEAVFAIDVETGHLQWTVQGQGIEHDGIAVAEGMVLLADKNLTDQERQRAIAETIRDTSTEDREPVDKQGNPIPPDLRKLVALDALTGAVRWSRPFNATDITLDDTVVSAGRVAVACMVKDGVVVVHGTGSLGHPYQEFLRGEFKRRAIFAFSADDGELLWSGRRNYRKRPIIVGDYIYAEPHAWSLKTGQPKTYVHPVSGNPEPFDCFRGYIGCSHLLASGGALFGNLDGIAHLNLDQNCGYTPLGNMSLACGSGAVPAGGLFVAPEGRSGCTCDTPIFTSIALYPRLKCRAYSVGVPAGVSTPKLTPVKHLAVNLGAPGFREDDAKTLWIPYPTRADAGGILGDWPPTYQHDETMCYRHGEDFLSIKGTDQPWIFTSGYEHDKPLKFKLIDDGDPPASYTVRLYFAEPDDLVQVGRRVFDVSLQGKRVLGEFDIVRETGGPRNAIIKEFSDVRVEGHLEVGFDAELKKPILCGIEAIRE